MDLTSDLWTGLFIGLAVGILVGIAMDDSYEILKKAYMERRKMNEQKAPSHSDKGRWRRMFNTKNWTTFGVVLTAIAVMQVSLGLFQVIAFTRQTNFINCQADYNQKTSVARKARVNAANRESTTLYAWLDTLPPLLAVKPGEKPDPAAVNAFSTTLAAAIEAHKSNVQAQKDNPYPPEPEDTCGKN